MNLISDKIIAAVLEILHILSMYNQPLIITILADELLYIIMQIGYEMDT